jgi:inhibitor of cysteine peptidase
MQRYIGGINKMTSKLITVGLMVVLVVSLFACSGVAKNVTIVGSSSVDEGVEIAAGGSITVVLESNPTTGFQWSEEAQISDSTVLKQVSHEYVAPDSELVGAAGQEIWKFEALREGTATISMEYSRPWEGGEKGERTYTLKVTVK